MKWFVSCFVQASEWSGKVNIFVFPYMLAKLFVSYYAVCSHLSTLSMGFVHEGFIILAEICGSHIKLSVFSRALLLEMHSLARGYFRACARVFHRDRDYPQSTRELMVLSTVKRYMNSN